MKKWFFLLCILGFVALLFLKPEHVEPVESAPPLVSERAKTPSPAKVAPLPKPTSKPKSISTSSKPAPEEADEVVPFVLKEGYAVAHGDIILGVPEDPNATSGHYKMPSPNYWEGSEIPYAIDNDVVNPDRIMMALRHIESKTGLHFVPYDDQPDAILFQAGKEHCLSALGRQGGIQPIKLSSRCGWNEITHEVLHSLGFIHEQSRSDRDIALEILWEYIDEKFHPQFAALPESFLGPAKNTAFDYHSIMLYSPRTFAKEKGYITMKSRSKVPISPSEQGLTQSDIERIKALFGLN